MRPNKEKILHAMRSFLFSMVNREFLVFLCFLALSGCFWLITALNDTCERELKVPVRLIGVPGNAIITTPPEDTLRITVRDKGFVMASYLYQAEVPALTVSFQLYANKKAGRGTMPAADVQKQLAAMLFASTKVVSQKPDKLEFWFNYGISKRVPVRLAGQVVPDENCYLAGVRFEPEQVTVYADHRQIDSITAVQTEPLHVLNFNDTTVMTVALRTTRGMKVVPDSVRLTLYPDVLTEETVEVPITPQNVPADKVLRTFPARVKVRFVVGAAQFRSIKPEQFLVVADWKALGGDHGEKCPLSIRRSPQNVRRPVLEFPEVDYLVESKE